LGLAEEMGSARWQAYSLCNMARALELQGQPKQSLAYLERSLALQGSVADPRLEASIVAEMGNAYDLLRDDGRALRQFHRSLELSRGAEDRLGEATALFGLARTSRRGNDLDVARGYVEGALDVAEALRNEVASGELRASYFSSIYRYHELCIDVLMNLHETRPRDGLAALAFAASERSRARSLLESLGEAEVDIRSGMDLGLLEREKALKRAIEERTGTGVGSGQTNQGATADSAEAQDLEEQYDLVLAEMRSRSPRYAALTQPQPLRLEEVQSQLLDEQPVGACSA
jgi:hypothetical protein